MKLITLIALLAVISGFAADSEPEIATLKLDGQPITNFSLGDQDKDLEIIFSSALSNSNNDFRFTTALVKNKESKNKCRKTISDNSRSTSLAPGNKIKVKNLFTKAAKKKGGVEQNRVLCIYSGGDEDGEGELVAHALYSISTKVPKIDSIKDLVAINSYIKFSVDYSNVKKTPKVEVCYRSTDGLIEGIEGEDCPTGFKSTTEKSLPITINGLKNHSRYIFKLRLLDGNNKSEWSEPEYATPVPAAFPLEVYDGEGGELAWSCSNSNGTSLLAALALMMVWFFYRRKLNNKATYLLLLISVSLLNPDQLNAEDGSLNIGIVGSIYQPDLDSERGSSNKLISPFYKNFFNSPTLPLLGLELDWHLYDGFGSLQLGFGLSYTMAKGRALALDSDDEVDSSNPIKNAIASLHMYQLRPQLTYIFNPYKEHFPLFPYVRTALVAHGYSFTGNDKPKIKPNGFRFGYQVSLGLMLMLDFLEPSAITEASGQGLFNHVYLKSEISYTQIDSFGQKGLQFSAKDIMGSDLPLMWSFGLIFELP